MGKFLIASPRRGEIIQAQPFDHPVQVVLDVFATVGGQLQPGVGFDPVGRALTDARRVQQAQRGLIWREALLGGQQEPELCLTLARSRNQKSLRKESEFAQESTTHHC